ncbi:hypothetical protein HO133_005869 [Letharia lupina]|nr:uncharacterized protein HO133_005869 [Letharia lupina]KAF6218520.1 hypothetical protein HO133_005869 [Letharia lupina]
MADGLNEARALRVTEILQDYQNIQRRIVQFQANPPRDECNEIGYSSLRQCHTEARTLLNVPYPPEMLHPPSGPNEAEKRQLQRVIIDASARRLQAHNIFLRAAVAIKWVQRRQSILQGRKPQNGHLQALRQADATMRNELAAITNERIANAFRTADQQAGYWLHDDPSLQTILGWIRTHH